LSEFTGERVIPELVDADLLNEHLARYRFAKHFAVGLKYPAHILDAGCGSGYGTAELSGAAASVTGTDISADAVGHARLRYGSAGVRFLQAACEALPFSAAAFDLVVAFEVIEHLDRWRELLAEANRVLKPSGVLLVSTPNRDYYAESRGTAGPNPFHRHEFDYEEFRQSLGGVFPHVRIWTQNHAEAIVFSPEQPRNAVLEASGSCDPEGAHFYLAVCSQSPIATDDVFAWVPSSANVLRERERHIAKLNGELEKKDAWLRQTLDAHSELQRNHEALMVELERQNNWAAELNREIALRNTRIGDLQKEVEIRLTWITDLESQIEGARIEIERLNADTSEVRHAAGAEIGRLESESAELQATLAERTAWAEQLNAEIAEYRGELQRIGASQWFRAGAKLGIGPRLRDGQ
jgi:SAM-dependent methyltransferase